MSATTPASAAERLASRAWKLLHVDPARASALAERALADAEQRRDRTGEAWSRLVLGFHALYFAPPAEAIAELERTEALFAASRLRTGQLLARTGLARGLWRLGRFDLALDHALELLDEGLACFGPVERGMLLNTIAGCYSAQNQSEQAFAYMYEALRGSRPARQRGFDVVLHCNIAHELMQLGDYDEALRHVDAGLVRIAPLASPRLRAVLLINRVVCLTELGRAVEAMADVREVSDMPAEGSGRGINASHFESLAIATLAAGDIALGRELVRLMRGAAREAIPDERLECRIAEAMLALAEADPARAGALLAEAEGQAGDGIMGLSLRLRCNYWALRSQVQEQQGDAAAALASLRHWQRLDRERARLASRAHYQAAALQTELLLMQRKLAEKDEQRRATERAKTELEATNRALQLKVQEVQTLQEQLRAQATRDVLTGLFNRRHLNDMLPALWSLARRDGQPLAVAIIDLDHFKAVNDEQGHDAGDRLLAGFGRLLATALRKSDIACRYGGEEFCVLMPHTGADAARRKLGALLKRWRTESLALGARGEAGTSFSAGITDSTQPLPSAEAMLQAADRELLAAKRAGRNRVRVAEIAITTD